MAIIYEMLIIFGGQTVQNGHYIKDDDDKQKRIIKCKTLVHLYWL